MQEEATAPENHPQLESKLHKIATKTTVPHLTTKEDVSQKALTLAMMEERYPQKARIRGYTDGSDTDGRDRWSWSLYLYPQLPTTELKVKPW